MGGAIRFFYSRRGGSRRLSRRGGVCIGQLLEAVNQKQNAYNGTYNAPCGCVPSVHSVKRRLEESVCHGLKRGSGSKRLKCIRKEGQPLCQLMRWPEARRVYITYVAFHPLTEEFFAFAETDMDVNNARENQKEAGFAHRDDKNVRCITPVCTVPNSPARSGRDGLRRPSMAKGCDTPPCEVCGMTQSRVILRLEGRPGPKVIPCGTLFEDGQPRFLKGQPLQTAATIP